MLCRRTPATRPAASAVLTLLLFMPLLLVVAFAVDLNYVWLTDTELQNAADAAAQAGASKLLVPPGVVTPAGVNPIDQATIKQATSDNAVSTAQAYARMHRAGGAPLDLNASDVVVGYSSPTAASSLPGNAWLFPNYVQVTVRRDATVSSGPLRLFFGGLFGTPTSNRQATATATVLSQGVTGFSGSGSRLLPLAMDLATFNWLKGIGPAPVGAVAQDQYTVRSTQEGDDGEDGEDKKRRPSTTLVKVSDGIREGKIDPDSTVPGNFGLVSLRNGKATSTADYDSWLQNGPSSDDLATFGPKGLQISVGTPQMMFGDTGMKASLDGSFQAILGQPRILILYSLVSGNGANAQYQVVGFVGATVVEASLKGGTKAVIVQLSPTIDPTATTTATGPGCATHVYKGVSLTR